MANSLPAARSIDRIEVPEQIKDHAEKCCNEVIATEAVAVGLEHVIAKLEDTVRGNPDAIHLVNAAMQLSRMVRERLHETNLDLQVLF